MNVLCNDLFRKPFYSSVLKKMDEQLNIERIFLIVGDGKRFYKQPSLDQKVVYRFPNLKIYNGDYSGCPYENKMKPLDKEFLDEMSLYEPEVLKMSERVNMVMDSGEKRFMDYHTHLRYWNTFLELAKIDVCLWFSKPHNVYDYIIYRLCQKKGICFLMQEILPFQSCFGHNYQTNYEKFDAKIIKKLEEAKSGGYVLSERMRKEYGVMSGAEETVAPVIGENRIRRIRHYIRNIKEMARVELKLFPRKIAFRISEDARVRKMIRQYEKMAVEPDYSKPYIFFALHYQPEMTTSPTGGWYVHQYLAVEMLSYFVPEGVMIYVKEHPVIKIIHRTTVHVEHYKRINKLKNVQLIKLDTSGEELTTHAAAVSAISGSVGYWGMFRLKPYLMFGDLAMKYAPGTFNIRNAQDCKSAIKAIFDDHFSFTEDDVKRYLSVLESEALTLDFCPFNDDIKEFDKSDIEKAAEGIVRTIRDYESEDNR